MMNYIIEHIIWMMNTFKFLLANLFIFPSLCPGKIRSIGALIILCCVGCLSQNKDKEVFVGKRNQPNIVFIMADDLGYNDLGIYGQKLIKTPNIDQMSSEGMRFTDFYAGSTVCSPSRAVLMTGLHSGHTRIRGNYARVGGLQKTPGSTSPPGHRRVGLLESDTTIGNILKRAGYRTGIMGKWHLSGYSMENLPIHRGFDEFRGRSLANRESHLPDMAFHQDKIVKVEEPFSAMFPDDLRTYNTIDFIKKNKGGPFFVILSLTSPHKPFEIDDQGIYAEKPWNEMSKNYAAMVGRIDDNVGRIMKTLKEENLDENTIVFFCSDNGGEYREHPEDWNNWTNLFQSNYPLKGGKADMYEGGIRVPMIIRWPGKIKSGQINSEPWYFPDIMPTLAEIAGGEAIDSTDGISILPALKGQHGKFTTDRFLYWEFDHRGFMQAARWKNWKLIRWTDYRKRIYGQAQMNDKRRNDKHPFLELYNLDQDIGETNNVVDQHPDVVKTILEYINNTRKDAPNWPLTETEKNSSERHQLIYPK